MRFKTNVTPSAINGDFNAGNETLMQFS